MANPPTKKPSLAEVTANMPKAIADTAKARVKGLGKSIVRTIHPKNIALRGAQIIHAGIMEELPEVGMATGYIAGIGAEIYNRAQGKKLKGQSNTQFMQQFMQQQTMNGGMGGGMSQQGGMGSSPEILQALSAINSSVKIVAQQAVGIHAELRTLTSITAKVWDVSKKSLAATRQGNKQQVELEKESNFKKQEDSDNEGPSKLGSLFNTAKSIASDPEEAVKGLVKKGLEFGAKHIGDAFLAITGIKSLMKFFSKDGKLLKQLPNLEKVAATDAARLSHFEKLSKGGKYANELSQAKLNAEASAKDVSELKGKISPKALKAYGKAASRIGGKGAAAEEGAALGGEGAAAEEGAALGVGIGGALVMAVLAAVVVAGVKGAFNDKNNWGKIASHVKDTFNKETTVDAIFDLVKQVDWGSFFGHMMEELFKGFHKVGGLLIKAGAFIGQLIGKSVLEFRKGIYANLAAVLKHIPGMGTAAAWSQAKANDIGAEIDKADKTYEQQMAAIDKQQADVDTAFEKRDAADIATSQSNQSDSTASLSTPPSDNTKNAVAIDQQSQKLGSTRNQAAAAPLLSNRQSAPPTPNIISAPTTNTNTSIQNFTNAQGRNGKNGSHVYSNVNT